MGAKAISACERTQKTGLSVFTKQLVLVMEVLGYQAAPGVIVKESVPIKLDNIRVLLFKRAYVIISKVYITYPQAITCLTILFAAPALVASAAVAPLGGSVLDKAVVARALVAGACPGAALRLLAIVVLALN